MFNSELLRGKVYNCFNEGDKISHKRIKETLRDIYNELDYNKAPKAVDLGQWFILKEIKITNKEEGKREKAYEIIKKKELGQD
jgi:hypothetical protein